MLETSYWHLAPAKHTFYNQLMAFPYIGDPRFASSSLVFHEVIWSRIVNGHIYLKDSDLFCGKIFY